MPHVGQDLAVDRHPDIGIEVLSQRERQLLLEDRPEELERVDESLRAHHPLLGVLVIEPGFGAVQEHLEALHGGLLPLGHAGEDEKRRSEERRVGKECRAGWAPYEEKTTGREG